MKKVFYPLAALAAIAVTAGPGSVVAESAAPTAFQATLNPVPTNHVNGSGTASLQINGAQTQVTIHTMGLLNAPHAMHVHIDGQGKCPDESFAKTHNGQKAISATDGATAYGEIMVALTTTGDTGPDSAFALDRMASGDPINYSRTITFDAHTISAIQGGKAVIVVHGTDYSGSGKYDNALGASEDAPHLPQTATAPALCGVLTAAAVSPSPSAPVDTTTSGQGITINNPSSSGSSSNSTLSVAALSVACASLGFSVATGIAVWNLLRRANRQP
ncbi:hypothetical protein [Kitasatospora camelliae]|uniref:CHRD domain-containing protein n=1 Tax=Kitasatospora camelliae TaxID=3156397 RepID=A0AAU8KAU6_9ACTN